MRVLFYRTGARHKKSHTGVGNIGSLHDMAVTVVENRRLIFLTAIFASGMLLGASGIKSGGGVTAEKLILMLDTWLELKTQQSFLTNMCNTFFISFVFMSATFCFGLCAVGLPAIAAVPFVRGLGYGVICGYLYSSQALYGAAKCFGIIVPGAVISVAATLLLCCEAMQMSLDTFMTIGGKKQNSENGFKPYSLKFMILCIVAGVGAITDALSAAIFIKII